MALPAVITIHKGREYWVRLIVPSQMFPILFMAVNIMLTKNLHQYRAHL